MWRRKLFLDLSVDLLTCDSEVELHKNIFIARATSVVWNLFKMEAIKKKMQAMKLEKDNAMDRADACEQQAKDANLRAERVGTKF